MRARIDEDAEIYAYRYYVTETQRLAGEGKYLTVRWADLIGDTASREKKEPEPEDNRSCAEIAADIWRRAARYEDVVYKEVAAE